MSTPAWRLISASILGIGLAMPAAAALAAVTVVNRDVKDHKLTVVEESGAKKTEHMLKPSQVLEGICGQGCIVRLNDSEEDEYELEAGDKVSIEDGYLYYDEPEAGQPAAGGAPQPGPAPQQPGAGEAPKKN